MGAREPSRRRSEKHAAEDVGCQFLLSFDLIESLLPVGRGELENAVMGPARKEAEKSAHVGEGFDLVEPGAGEQRDEDGVDPGSVVATDEEPVSTAENLAAQIQLANVVAEGKPSVVEEATQGNALVHCIADAGCHRRFVENEIDLGFAPCKELVGHGRGFATANALLLLPC